jgi:CHAT domain-containing protein
LDPDRAKEVRQLSRTVYDWLIRPIAAQLQAQTQSNPTPINTLVFILDSY